MAQGSPFYAQKPVAGAGEMAPPMIEKHRIYRI